jgi:hypothetical protein
VGPLWALLRTIGRVESGAVVRRAVVAGAIAVLGSLGLAGCGSGSISYGVGYSVGQSLAAGDAGFSAPHAQVVVKCERQWRLSGSAIDSRSSWINGCIRGFDQVEAEVTSTAHG